MKQRKMSSWDSKLVQWAAFTLMFTATSSFAQKPVSPPIDSNRGVERWTEGTINDALSQSAAGATIPMSHYTFNGPRGTFKGVLVGGNPFGNPNPVTIEAVLIPLIVYIKRQDGTLATFDPTVPDPCDLDGGFSAEYRFRHSPLVVSSPLTFNDVTVGNAQYIDGFMQAEFWNSTGGSPSYSNPLHWSFASAASYVPQLLDLTVAITDGTGCSERGIVAQEIFGSFMKGVMIPFLQSTGVISPTKFAFFLTRNVVTSHSNPPTPSGIFEGQHYSAGSPVQTWARAAYSIGSDVKTASHEIAEWMNDPLLTNSTPPWGDEGEVKAGSCGKKMEVGDPLNGRSAPLITVSGYPYHVQELAFFSWFFDEPGDTSLGAGGKFSSNGKFTGPSKACPPGGTY
jgi:hypothetical protein